MIRPGHAVFHTKNVQLIFIKNCHHSQNVVSLGATKVTPNENIRSTKPEKRNCYFGNEYQLKAHKSYSQVKVFGTWLLFWQIPSQKIIQQTSCILECSIQFGLSKQSNGEKCIPWYYPAVDPDARMCDPYETRDFNGEIEKMPSNECKVLSYIKTRGWWPYGPAATRAMKISHLMLKDIYPCRHVYIAPK